MMKLVKIAAVTAMLSSAIALPTSAAALSSENGSLTIDWVNPTRPNAPCTTQEPVGVYSVSANSVKGYLYNATCNPDPSVNPDVANLVFYDLEGEERCFGRMTISYGSVLESGRRAAATTWNIDGVIPGQRCEGAGGTVRVNVYSPTPTPPTTESEPSSPAN